MFQHNPMNQQIQGDFQDLERDIKGQCKQYMNFHVIAQMNDGSQFDGIIEGMDENGVTMLIPEDIDPQQMGEIRDTRQFGFDYGYDDYDDYGRPRRRRFRRYRRQQFPFGLLTRLFLYPYYTPYPYYPFYPGY
ncbi:hypothetical protein [Paucisalibacillus sp. EB02]|uniref:hypothetical protein n=1 Tax=Paucisalibacillus sp. EB02 TaxID=1347087 RepID=UPI0004B221E9|nr:hypothetical protein [Paucisalibacillus sp. EB02]